MWRRVVSSSSAQLQILASSPGRSNHQLLISSSSSLSTTPFQGSFAPFSSHASFTSSLDSAFDSIHLHEEVESELEGKHNTSRQSASSCKYDDHNNGQRQYNQNAVYADSLRGPQQNSYQFSQSYRGGSRGNEFVNNPVQQSGYFSGNYSHENIGRQQTTKQEWMQYSNQQNTNGSYNNNKTMYQQRASYGEYQSSSHVREHQKSPNVGQYQQNTHGRQLHQIPPVGQQNTHVGQFQQVPPVGQYQQISHVGQFQQIPPVGLYQQNTHAGQFQQSTPVGQYQQIPPVGQYQKSGLVGQYQQGETPHDGQYQQIPPVGQYQQSTPVGHQQTPHVGQYQQIPHVGQCQQIPPVGQYQQIPPVGQYQQIAPVGQYQQIPPVGHQQTPHVVQSADDSESNHYSVMGTLEGLDWFCKEGKVKEAVEVLGLLQKQHMHVKLQYYLQLMQACGEAEALDEAKAVHEHTKLLSPLEVSTYNKILEMYWKCGSMENALMVFNDMPNRNLMSWGIMIAWLAKNGLGEDAIDLYTRFKKEGLKPDGQMFIGVFNACSVVGDAYEGLLHFESMSKDYGIVPTMDHYTSVVDMLGTVGYLDEALEFINKMPMEPNVDVWKTLMNHCRVHGNLELGDRCAELVDQLDPSCLDEKSKAGLVPVKESDSKEKEKKKVEARNLLEVGSRVHEYRAGDRSHPNTDKFYTLLRGMREQMKELGYIPETRFVLHDIDQESKEDALLGHSERLAIADGLLSSPARSDMRIIKNLRVCGDCHTALKIISKIVGRELIIRDAKRFHHFKDGKCSCNDYW